MCLQGRLEFVAAASWLRLRRFCFRELWLLLGRGGGSCFDSVGKVERSVSAVSALFLEDTAVAAGSVSGSDVFLIRASCRILGGQRGGVLCFVSGETVVSTCAFGQHCCRYV